MFCIVSVPFRLKQQLSCGQVACAARAGRLAATAGAAGAAGAAAAIAAGIKLADGLIGGVNGEVVDVLDLEVLNVQFHQLVRNVFHGLSFLSGLVRGRELGSIPYTLQLTLVVGSLSSA
jgi:hypothetical protein